MIEPYVPPVEVRINLREPEARKAVFPRCGRDGRPDKNTEDFLAEEEDIDLLAEEEPEEEEGPEDEVARILENARQEADRLLMDARQRAAAEHEAAREAGYNAGFEAGYEEGRTKAIEAGRQELTEQIAAFREDMEAALRSVETAKEKCIRTYLDELKDCAIAIGEKVIRVSLRSSGEVIRQMIIAATEKLKKTAWVKIYIDKMDYDLMMEADADIIGELSHLSDNIKFIVMDKEDCGDCIIEMPEEIVDISVNTQIENIKDILENVRV